MEPYKVLFLCTGNSARSIIAEALLNHWGEGRFRAYSAGSRPRGEVHPLGLEVLERARVSAPDARSKSWTEFSQPGSPEMDFVLTVCGNAANEVCPVWPGRPATAHWGVDDPAAVEGSREDQLGAFSRALHELEARVKMLTRLPLENLDRAAVEERLRAIGRSGSQREP